jgi:hypothetical protein
MQQHSPQEEAAMEAQLMNVMMNTANIQSNECYSPCPMVMSSALDLPVEDDDDALWDSLWRLVDGEDGSSGGDSGEY